MKVQFYIIQFVLTLFLVFIFPIMIFAETNVVTVEIVKFKFTPQNITVKPGTTVRWINKEKRQYHSVWFEALGEPEPEYIFPDETFERKFDKAGAFPYRCGPHPEMTGAVNVK